MFCWFILIWFVVWFVVCFDIWFDLIWFDLIFFKKNTLQRLCVAFLDSQTFSLIELWLSVKKKLVFFLKNKTIEFFLFKIDKFECWKFKTENWFFYQFTHELDFCSCNLLLALVSDRHLDINGFAYTYVYFPLVGWFKTLCK